MQSKNLKALKMYRPHIYEKLSRFKNSSKYRIAPPREKGKNPNLFHSQKNAYFYDVNDPIQGVNQKLTAKGIRLPQLSIFIGLALGYELLIFMKRATQDFSMIVVEKDLDLFIAAISIVDLTEAFKNPNIEFILDTPINDVFPLIYRVLESGNNLGYIKAINVIENDLSFLENKEYYLEVFAHLRDSVKKILQKFGNSPSDSLIGIDNTFGNISEIINNPGIKDLYGKFKGVPGIVVATGPSLNKNVELLKGLEDKAVICAADASVRVMKEYGLKPHMATSLERILPTSKLFEGLTEHDLEDIFLAACPVIRPETYANFKGERIIVYRNFATFEWLDIEKGILDIGPSSANMAFKILEVLGCDPIILIGQDLALGEEDNTHAKGATYGQKENGNYMKRKCMVEGNYTPELVSTDAWYQFLKHYEKDISEYSGRVINATEGGAKIHGTELMPFSEAIDQFIDKEFSVLETIKASLNKPTDQQKDTELKAVREKVDEAILYCQYVLKEFAGAYDTCVEYQSKITEPFKNGEEIDAQLSEKFMNEVTSKLSVFGEEKFRLILMHYVQSYNIMTLVEVHGMIADELPSIDLNNRIIVRFKDMYAVMVKLIEKMLELFGVLRNNLKQIDQQNNLS